METDEVIVEDRFGRRRVMLYRAAVRAEARGIVAIVDDPAQAMTKSPAVPDTDKMVRAASRKTSRPRRRRKSK